MLLVNLIRPRRPIVFATLCSVSNSKTLGLTWLILECQLYDHDNDTNDIKVDSYPQLKGNPVSSAQPSFLQKNLILNLSRLDLTGYAFMITDFAECLKSASQKIELGANYRSLISIFLEPNSETGTGSRIFQAFINLLGQLDYRFAITLIDLSLALR